MLGMAGSAAASFGLCVLAILALRPVAVAIDLIDRPGGRKTHHGEVPIVGGIAMFMGAVLGLGLVPLPAASALAFLAASALLVTVGLFDDRFDLSPWMRLPAQIAAAIVLMLGSEATVVSLGNPFGSGEIQLSGYASYVFTVMITIAAINAFNMLDGMDGVAGAMAVIALVALAYIAGDGALPVAAAVSWVFIGAVAAFLMFNLPTRLNRGMRCFMGDAGSTLLGFAIAWLCVMVSQGEHKAVSPVTMLWIVAVPLYELVWTTARRLLRGASPFLADSDHFHHLLLKAGFGVRAAFALFVALAALLATFGILADRIGMAEWLSFTLLILGGVAVIRLMYRAEIMWALVPLSLRRVPPLDSPRKTRDAGPAATTETLGVERRG